MRAALVWSQLHLSCIADPSLTSPIAESTPRKLFAETFSAFFGHIRDFTFCPNSIFHICVQIQYSTFHILNISCSSNFLLPAKQSLRNMGVRLPVPSSPLLNLICSQVELASTTLHCPQNIRSNWWNCFGKDLSGIICWFCQEIFRFWCTSQVPRLTWSRVGWVEEPD